MKRRLIFLMAGLLCVLTACTSEKMDALMIAEEYGAADVVTKRRK